MIATVALFLFSVSLFLAVAAWVGEEGLRRVGVPMRWVWLAAMAAAPLLLVAPLVVPGGASEQGPVAAVIAPAVELAPLVIGPAARPAVPDGAIGALWLLLSGGMVLVLVGTSLGLRRQRAGWERSSVLGRSVYLSPRCGPAVAGFVRPWIVLPRWALGLPDRDLGLVVLHEEEHLRARDSLVLALALLLVVATPWNPVTWWQLRRLRTAMEMDCDRRVLRREPDREGYGRSLLSVAGRASGRSLGLAAFTERSTSLERRIVAMTVKTSRWNPMLAALLLVAAAVAGLQACGVAIPLADDQQAKEAVPDRVPSPPASVVIPPPSAGQPTAPGGAAPSGRAGARGRAPTGTPGAPVGPAGTGPTGPGAPTASAGPVPPTRPAVEKDLSEPTFTPFTVAPSILNREEVIQAMRQEYPPLLRDAGIGGTVRVYFLIGEDGAVRQVRIDKGSGHQALDEAAMRVADVYRFSPALNKDAEVPVWVSFPITFQVR